MLTPVALRCLSGVNHSFRSRVLGVANHLFSDRVLDNLRAAQGVIGFRKRHGVDRLEAACSRALAYGNPKYRAVTTILEKGLDQQLDCLAPRRSPSGAYTGIGRFFRERSRVMDQILKLQREVPGGCPASSVYSGQES